MANRLIHEDAVIALVQGKIDALEDRIERCACNLSDARAQIRALQTVISHLRFIPDAGSSDDTHPFPISDTLEI
jgi:hypothetical protein